MARLPIPKGFALFAILAITSALPYDTPRDHHKRQAYYYIPTGVPFPTASPTAISRAYPTAYPTGTSVIDTGTGTASGISVPTLQPYWDTNPNPSFYIHKRFEGPRTAVRQLEPYYAYLGDSDGPTPTSYSGGVTGTAMRVPASTGVAYQTGTGVFPTGYR